MARDYLHPIIEFNREKTIDLTEVAALEVTTGKSATFNAGATLTEGESVLELRAPASLNDTSGAIYIIVNEEVLEKLRNVIRR